MLISTQYSLASYHDLHKFSVERPNEFWTLLWKFLDIKASSQPSKVCKKHCNIGARLRAHPSQAIDEALRIDQFPPFFAGAKLNYAENILRTRGNGIALKCIDESSLRKPESITWDDLRAQVREAADAMHFSGVRRHDVVVGMSAPLDPT
jgi:acetoacetyl-CoA synthetase